MKMTPMELVERLVALVPRPRVHLVCFHGVFALHYKFRKMIVPKPTESLVLNQNVTESELAKMKNFTWARLLARVFNIDVDKHVSNLQKNINKYENDYFLKYNHSLTFLELLNMVEVERVKDAQLPLGYSNFHYFFRPK